MHLKKLLKKIKLIDNLTTTLNISREEFVNKFSLVTENRSSRFFFNPFSSDNKTFEGKVNFSNFEIKKIRKPINSLGSTATAKGIIRESNGSVIIETEIIGFTSLMLIPLIFIILFYTIAIIAASIKFFILLFIGIHGAFMISLFYYILRYSVQSMKYQLEREFFYLTKNY